MHEAHADGSGLLFDLTLSFPFLLAIGLYIGAGFVSNRSPHLQKWPTWRYVCWSIGVLCAGLAVIGPLADQARIDFRAHMMGHLLLGMLAPLLLVLAAPVTLVLRTLPVSAAKKLTFLLKSTYVRVISHPISASILNIGGLWVLYTTDLYHMMHQSLWIHVLVHVHVFLAGYLFTMAMIYTEPVAHRYSYLYRAIVFIIALAGHGILSKYLYASPPEGVSQRQAEAGSMLMYYGGDAIDAVLIFILCLQWYKATQPDKSIPASQ
ncbi:cytochrome c oxidase assembly protein [Halobacillus sp. Nhm2S1]|uniref:cytochrome c oxidase assembly protein n=1 Tax=Halobacillus sp. Nhm2S1 TaxID=2866716 RepID=UPI001C72E7C5|nr:cytochrome c oxidase assembly protein [Halobacillus sp. Nhm2S1]MBX0356927.1 cytochrome c oxidase assembly protein [Halobacillus sp. Nhm2S1]